MSALLYLPHPGEDEELMFVDIRRLQVATNAMSGLSGGGVLSSPQHTGSYMYEVQVTYSGTTTLDPRERN